MVKHVSPFKTFHTSKPTNNYLNVLNRMQNPFDNRYKYILNVIDTYSKFLWSFTLKTKFSIIVSNCLQKSFYNVEPPLFLHSDDRKELKNTFISDLATEFKIHLIFGLPCHPQSQGQVERLNQTIKSC